MVTPDFMLGYERLLAGSVMNADAPAIRAAGEVARPEDFLIRSYGQVYDAAQFLARSDKFVSFATVGYVLHERGQLDDVGAEPALVELAFQDGAMSHGWEGGLVPLARLVHEYAERRRALQGLERQAQRIVKGEKRVTAAYEQHPGTLEPLR